MNENVSFTDYVSGIQLPDCCKLTVNWKNGKTSQFPKMTISSNFFDTVLLVLLSLVTGSSFMPILSLDLEL